MVFWWGYQLVHTTFDSPWQELLASDRVQCLIKLIDEIESERIATWKFFGDYFFVVVFLDAQGLPILRMWDCEMFTAPCQLLSAKLICITGLADAMLTRIFDIDHDRAHAKRRQLHTYDPQELAIYGQYLATLNPRGNFDRTHFHVEDTWSGLYAFAYVAFDAYCESATKARKAALCWMWCRKLPRDVSRIIASMVFDSRMDPELWDVHPKFRVKKQRV